MITKGILRPSFLLCYHSINIQKRQYKYQAQRTQNTLNMIKLYQEHLEHDQQEFYFSIACRNIARNLRRSTQEEFHHIHSFLGKNMKNLLSLKVQSMSIVQLSDVINFLNISDKNYSFNKNKGFLQFIDNVLYRMFQQLEKFVDVERKRSYYLKCIKCSNFFQSKYLYTFLRSFNKEKFEIYSSYSYLQILYGIQEINLMDPKSIEEKSQIVQKIAQEVRNNKIIYSSNPENNFNLLTHYKELQQFLKILYCHNQDKLAQQYQDYYTREYNKFTTQDIIRFQKLCSQFYGESNIFKNATQVILDSIDEKGQTCMDPFFILRLVGHMKDKEQLDKACQRWEQKLLKMIKHYFSNQQVLGSQIIQIIPYLIRNNLFRYENNASLVDGYNIIVTRFIMKNRNEIYSTAILLQNFFINLQIHNYKRVIEIIQLLFQKFKVFGKQSFFYVMFIEQARQFLTSLNYPVNINSKTINQGIFKTKKYTSLQDYMQKIYQNSSYHDCITKKIIKSNIFFLQSNIRLLSKTFSYVQFYQNLQGKFIHLGYHKRLIKNFLYLHIPQEHQEKYYSLISKMYSGTEIVLDLVRDKKNVYMRESSLQTLFIKKFICSLPTNKILEVFSSKYTVHFYFIFDYQTLMEYVEVIMKDSCIQEQSYRNIILLIIYYHQQYTMDQYTIKEFVFMIMSHTHNDSIKKSVQQLCQENGVIQIYDKVIEPSSVQKQGNLNYSQSIKFVLSLRQFSQAYHPIIQNIINTDLSSNQLSYHQHLKHLIKITKHISRLHRISPHICHTLISTLLQTAKALQEQKYLVLEVFSLFYDLKWYHSQIITLVNKFLSESTEWKKQYNVVPLFTKIAHYPKQPSQCLQLLPTLLNLFAFSPCQLQIDIIKVFCLEHPTLSVNSKYYNDDMIKYLSYIISRINQKLPFYISKNIQKDSMNQKQARLYRISSKKNQIIVNTKWGTMFQSYSSEGKTQKILNHDQQLIRKVIFNHQSQLQLSPTDIQFI